MKKAILQHIVKYVLQNWVVKLVDVDPRVLKEYGISQIEKTENDVIVIFINKK